jgi:hypothetical protein
MTASLKSICIISRSRDSPCALRGTARGRSLSIAALTLVACTGCTRGDPERIRAGHTPKEPPHSPVTATPAQQVAIERCDGVGPMACKAAPSSHAELCASASTCIESFTTDKNYVSNMSIECDASDRKNIETAYSKPVPAPRESGLSELSLVTMVAVEDEYRNVFGSSYLVATRAHGSCLVDVVHGWDRHSLTPDTSFVAEWRPAAHGFRLDVRSRQVLHEALDQEELASGESDVRSDDCVRITYDVAAGRFTRVSESTAEGDCGSGD